MPKTATKSKNKKIKKTTSSAGQGAHVSVAIICTLFVALVIAITFGVVAFSGISSYNNSINSAKLAVFDDIADEYIASQDLTDNGISEVYQMTGYGISDEDGAFYITFDFADPSDQTISVSENGELSADSLRHGIVYFWEDKERGGYSHAYSYHDDANYHPDGTYVRVSQ